MYSRYAKGVAPQEGCHCTLFGTHNSLGSWYTYKQHITHKLAINQILTFEYNFCLFILIYIHKL